MFPYQRSYFQTTLIEKLNYWKSPQCKGEFYPNIDVKPPLGIQILENGYYHLSDSYVAYVDLTNGLIVRISNNRSTASWDCFVELHQKGVEFNNLRMDVPLFKDSLIIENHGIWEYAELRSPNNQYGINYYDMWGDDSADFSLEQYELSDLTVSTFEDAKEGYLEKNWKPPLISESALNRNKELFFSYIEQFKILLNTMVPIAKKHNCGLPYIEACFIKHLYKDTQGFFWSDIDQLDWNMNVEEFKRASLSDINHVALFMRECGLLTPENCFDINDYARKEWLTI
jgi:hypothetical protein